MPSFQCYPIDDSDTIWLYCPSWAAAITFAVFFGLATTAHILQAFIFRKPFALVLIMGGIWETGGYAARILSVQYQLNETVFTVQQLLIILAPLWINAFVYMCLGRMIHFYLAHDRVFRIRARRITLMFVLFDITAFLIQVTGGLMLNSTYPASTQKLGMRVYMSGVGVQIGFIGVFIALAIQFQRLVAREDFYSGHHTHANDITTTTPAYLPKSYPPKSTRQATKLLSAIYTVLLLITFRNIYRLIEFSAGIESSITRHEWYTFVFDSVPMLFCLLIFNVLHPGFVLRGPRCDFSEENRERKETKRVKKRETKEGKRMEKEAKKEMKRVEKEDEKARKMVEKIGRKEGKRDRREMGRQNTV